MLMESSLLEGTIIGAAAFAVVPIDGSRGACLFGAVAAALGDGIEPTDAEIAAALDLVSDLNAEFFQ